MTGQTVIMSALKERLENLKNGNGEILLKTVMSPARSLTPQTVFDLCPDLTHFPAALILPGKQLPDNKGLTWTLTLEVFLIAEQYHPEALPLSYFMLLAEVLSAFSTDEKGKTPLIGDAHILLRESKTAMFGETFPGWVITITACWG